jgi:hypothetical protein
MEGFVVINYGGAVVLPSRAGHVKPDSEGNQPCMIPREGLDETAKGLLNSASISQASLSVIYRSSCFGSPLIPSLFPS